MSTNHGLRDRLRRAVRRRWLAYALRGISDNDNHKGLERIYRIPDPWNADSPTEHFRFEVTNRIIRRRFGEVGSLLEIGCGEGAQSKYLRQLCGTLYGIDVSRTAVERARMRCPDAHYFVGDVHCQPWLATGTRLDLVVACEVLYYVSDVRAMIQAMTMIGRSCLVTFFTPEAHKLVDAMESIPNLEKDWIYKDGITWLVGYWQNP